MPFGSFSLGTPNCCPLLPAIVTSSFVGNKLAPQMDNNVRVPQPNSSYGYNMAGSGRYPAFWSEPGTGWGSNNRSTVTYLSEIR